MTHCMLQPRAEGTHCILIGGETRERGLASVLLHTHTHARAPRARTLLEHFVPTSTHCSARWTSPWLSLAFFAHKKDVTWLFLCVVIGLLWFGFWVVVIYLFIFIAWTARCVLGKCAFLIFSMM